MSYSFRPSELARPASSPVVPRSILIKVEGLYLATAGMRTTASLLDGEQTFSTIASSQRSP